MALVKRINSLLAAALVVLGSDLPAVAQQEGEPPTTDVGRLRTESGVDPARVQSRAAFSVLLQGLPGDAGQASMRGSLVQGVNRWSFTLKGDVVAQHSFTINPALFFATHPQYTFHLFKDGAAPDLQVLTIRSFLATFTSSGYFFVFEPRPVFDFANDITDVVLSPIVGKALGAGFNVLPLAEFPTGSKARELRGNLYQVGLQKAS